MWAPSIPPQCSLRCYGTLQVCLFLERLWIILPLPLYHLPFSISLDIHGVPTLWSSKLGVWENGITLSLSLSLSAHQECEQEGVWGENGYMCMYMSESLRYSSETITTLIIGCTPIQNKKLKEKPFPVPVLRKKEWRPEREDSAFCNRGVWRSVTVVRQCFLTVQKQRTLSLTPELEALDKLMTPLSFNFLI